ncbi:hypothetical protein [Bosea sp. RAC05]|uniref:hypothetical protein n=1 Tax=Bosea sp. RAC05 TaxID=1842539 RepID=UPI00083CA9EB|nr:hypothetical protein [Bosea sp. RAC05]AOG02800.1 hypothetical protein BSY19_5249 [Bosea sp. RAC05]
MSAIPQSSVPDFLSNFLLDQQQRLALTDQTRKRAVAMVAETGIAGMSEADLYLEWFNDALCDKDIRTKAGLDPAAHYLDWLADRLLEPFRVSYRTYNKIKRLWGVETVNLVVNVVWPQEIAWGHRMRLSGDDRVAFMANVFLVSAARDPSRECLRLAEARMNAVQDLGYSMAVAHEFTPSQIRSDPHVGSGFEPLFIRAYRPLVAERISSMTPAQLSHLAETVRHKESLERRGLAAQRAVMACRRSPLSRINGVISSAIEMKYDSDRLVLAEEMFLDKLAAGEITVDLDVGLPYRDFINFIRHTPPDSILEASLPVDAMVAEAALFTVVANPEGFISTLPEQYHQLQAGVRTVFGSWLRPIASRQRATPRDLVCDYGFHLVRNGFRKIPTFVTGP